MTKMEEYLKGVVCQENPAKVEGEDLPYGC